MPSSPNPFSRRTFLKGVGAAGALAVGGPVLAACSTASTGATGTTPASSTTASDTVGASSTGVMTSSSSPATSSAGPKSLNLMIPSWVDAKFIADVMQTAAGGKIGATINLVTTDDGTYPAQAAAAQKAGQAPDLLMWTAQGIAAFLAAGVTLAPLDDFAKSEDKAAFYPQDYESNSIDNVLLGLGFRSDCRGIAYRGDFAKTAPPANSTFDAFGTWIQGLNGANRVAFGYEAKPGDGRSSSNFLPMIWSTGAPFVTKVGGKWTIGFQPEQMTQVLQFYYDTVHTWKVTSSDVANWGYQETDSKFAKGTMAAYSAGPFVTANTQKFPDTRKNLKITSLPYAKQPSNFWEELSFMVHKDSKKQDLAFQFIEAMRSVEIQNQIVARTADAWLGVRIASNDAITDPILLSFAKLLKQAQVPEPLNVAPIFNGAILPALGEMALKGTKPADMTVTLMKNMQGALDQLNA